MQKFLKRLLSVLRRTFSQITKAVSDETLRLQTDLKETASEEAAPEKTVDAAALEKISAEDRLSIQKNAALVIELASRRYDKEIGYDRAGVEWLDSFIQGYYQERGEEEGEDNEHDKSVQVLGSYLGEVMIHNYGGDWVMHDHGLGIRFADGSWVFPFTKVRKQLSNGAKIRYCRSIM